MKKYAKIKKDTLNKALNYLAYVESYSKAQMLFFESMSSHSDDKYAVFKEMFENIYENVHDSRELLVKES